MGFQKWLRIVIPEVQLYDFVKERGFRGKKLNAISKLQVSGKSIIQNNTPLSSTVPYSSDAVKEVLTDAKLGVKNLSLVKTNEELDSIFSEIKKEINKNVLEQQRFIDDLIVCFKKAFLAREKGKLQNAILISGAPGTGKFTSLTYLIDLMYKKKLTPYSRFKVIDLSRYTKEEIRTNFITDITAAFEFGIGTVCFTGIENVETEVLQYISQLFEEGFFRTPEGILIDASDYFLVICLDQEIQEHDLDNQIPPVVANKISASLLKSIRSFAYTNALSEYTLEIMLKQHLSKAAVRLEKQSQLHISFEPSIFRNLAKQILDTKKYGDAVETLVEVDFFNTMLEHRARGELKPGDKLVIRCSEDILYAATSNKELSLKATSLIKEEKLEDILEELQQLTGLSSVKQFVQELLGTVNSQKQREQLGQKNTSMALHMVFTGNPGTGKTTVARLISRILKAMGLLSHGQLVEVARQDLVGEYVGSTAPKTSHKIQEAFGGVLFIDEAYTLARDKRDFFGLEAIDTIVKAMEDNRDNLVVVLAGYTQEMDTFLKTNPGLRSRFPFIVEFPDYTPANMYEILHSMAKSKDCTIEPEAHGGLLELFETKQIPGRNDSGNGRLVRNLFEEAIRKQSVRLNSEVGEQKNWKLLTRRDFGVGEKKQFNIEDSFADIIGLDNVKNFVRTLEKQIQANKRRKEAGVAIDTAQTLNIVFSGNPGTGKTTVARLLAEMLKSLGILKKGHLVEVDRSHLVAEYMGQTAIKTKEVVDSALGGVLFIDEAYSLVEDGVSGGGFGKEAIDTLVRLIENHKDNLVVVLAGYTNEMNQFMKVNPGLSSRFPLKIEFLDYSPEEMVLMTDKIAKSKGFEINSKVKDGLLEFYNKKQIPGKNDSGNGRLVRNTVEEAIRNQAIRIMEQDTIPHEQLNLLIAKDFNIQTESTNTKNALIELDNIIGLEEVKHFVRSLSAQIEVTNKRKSMGLPHDGSQSLHMIFKGNPGTGKTTVARILAKRLKELGVIKLDEILETDRSGLVAGYIGQTALKTREVLERALGGVLFVDEAYALVSGGSNDFGQEAIDTIVKFMDDNRENIIVILAGYDEDMERFLNANAGLQSRFPNIITFSDYSASDLLKISHGILKGKGYKVNNEGEQVLFNIFKRLEGNKTAGNGRLARNLCEMAIRQHALRVSVLENPTIDDLTTLIPDDFKKGEN